MSIKVEQEIFEIIENIILDNKSIHKVNAVNSFKMTRYGFFDLDEKKSIYLTSKARKIYDNFCKKLLFEMTVNKVKNALDVLLEKPGSTTQHRAVWNFVGGPEKFTRDQILDCLKYLRDKENYLKSYQTSSNKFQTFWRLAKDEPTTPTFEVN